MGEYTEIALRLSRNACYLSFSPLENWLIVGLKSTSDRVDFRLFTLSSGEDDLQRPKTFEIKEHDLEEEQNED